MLNRPCWTEDQSQVHSHIISRDSESRETGSRYCCEGARKGQTWRVDVYRLAKCGQLRASLLLAEEEANMRSGHFWICKVGTVPGSMTCVEKKFDSAR